jgi:hypothetical protein
LRAVAYGVVAGLFLTLSKIYIDITGAARKRPEGDDV